MGFGVIVLHRPKSVDLACALALKQEEELAKTRTKVFNKEYTKTAYKPLQDKNNNTEVDVGKPKVQKPEFEDRLATLKEFKRRNGLCFKCGEKWATITNAEPRYPCLL
jgi:hypothetical protein